MSADFWFQTTGGIDPGLIGNSLRFRKSQYLSRSISVTSPNRNQFTYSVWLKDTLPTRQPDHSALFSVDRGGQAEVMTRDYGRQLYFSIGGNNEIGNSKPKALVRDNTGWYHFIYRFDTTLSNVDDRMRIYMNGVYMGNQRTVGIGQNVGTNFIGVAGGTNYLGCIRPGTWFWDGYMAECHFVDGQSLDPTEFGEFDDFGNWVAKKVSVSDYGVNGFYLDFSDPANIGADRSGKGNNFSPTGFELNNTISHLYDWSADSPTNVFGGFNPNHMEYSSNSNNTPLFIKGGGVTGYWNGNNIGNTRGNLELEPGGKYYFEAHNGSGGNNAAFPSVGVGKIWYSRSTSVNQWIYNGFKIEGSNPNTTRTTIKVYANGSESGTIPMSIAWQRGDDVGVAVDGTKGSNNITVYINGVQSAQFGFDLNFWEGPFGVYADVSSQPNQEVHLNCGQRPWRNSIPSGYQPLSTAALPAVEITDPAQHFDTVLDTGANILNSSTAKFPKGLYWIKDRATYRHQLVDTVRGTNKALWMSTDVEANYTAPPGSSCVSWCWNLMDDRSNGFDIVTWTGTSAVKTIPHSLGRTPGMIWVKNRTQGQPWMLYHQKIGPKRAMQLSQNDEQSSESAQYWNNTAPTSTNFTVNSHPGVNRTGDSMIAYVFAEIPGYSSFGEYKGSNNSDGPFIYTGFKPAFIIAKAYKNSGTPWYIYDIKRNLWNPVDNQLSTTTSGGEQVVTNNTFDFCCNGFKVRGTGGTTTNSSDGVIYFAFADHPFGASNVYPAPAR